ncbi:hypothetical protein [uncultured Bilophila sp.]|uniref:hypothetical protein n=1 Tax=uncultured Bilophila sp. TaxID=529385 RepID=UPI0025982D81|nr:hypothetical protein [uncultured Bilophila sp.]
MGKSIITEDINMAEEKKEKKPICFVIMPISDHPDYDAGHFTRVYNHIFKPAIELAGYIPIRSDDETKSNNIVADIIKKIVVSDMALCDISTRNANVLYELGIRHAFDKPVVLVKDEKTNSIFDISGIRYTDYNSSLRIDRVSPDIQKIKKSIESHSGDDIESSVLKLSMINYSAKLPKQNTVTADTQLLLNAIRSLDDKINKSYMRSRTMPHFVGRVSLGGRTFNVEDSVFDSKGVEIGKIKAIDVNKERIIIVNDDTNKVYSFNDILDKGIDVIPF